MIAADIPVKFPIPFANAAGVSYIESIPQASQIGITDGRASLNDGFPPLNFLPFGSGGVAPFGKDFNGILNQITAWNQWQGAGGPIYYDATYSGDIGGYPQGATLSNASTPGLYWISAVDNNTSDPDTGGANWVAFPTIATAAQIWAGTDNTALVTSAGLAAASAQQTLTDAATITWNIANGYEAAITLTTAVGSTRAMGTPTNIITGRPLTIAIRQPASGAACALTWPSIFDWMGVGAPTLSTANGVRDFVSFQYDTLTSKLISSFLKGS